jgi:hypothetical protein
MGRSPHCSWHEWRPSCDALSGITRDKNEKTNLKDHIMLRREKSFESLRRYVSERIKMVIARISNIHL